MKFGEKLFQTKLLSRLSHKVCRLLSSPVLMRKSTSNKCEMNCFTCVERAFFPRTFHAGVTPGEMRLNNFPQFSFVEVILLYETTCLEAFCAVIM